MTDQAQVEVVAFAGAAQAGAALRLLCATQAVPPGMLLPQTGLDQLRLLDHLPQRAVSTLLARAKQPLFAVATAAGALPAAAAGPEEATRSSPRVFAEDERSMMDLVEELRRCSKPLPGEPRWRGGSPEQQLAAAAAAGLQAGPLTPQLYEFGDELEAGSAPALMSFASSLTYEDFKAAGDHTTRWSKCLPESGPSNVWALRIMRILTQLLCCVILLANSSGWQSALPAALLLACGPTVEAVECFCAYARTRLLIEDSIG